MNRIKELILDDNPREFLRWDVIRRAMTVTHVDYVDVEFAYLKSRSDWDSRWREAIRESSVGHPVPYWRYRQTSGNLIHHAYHLAQFEEKTTLNLENVNYIFEFGGGYGNMCRLLHNLGFHGKYILFDLPASLALQRYFLKSIGIEVHSINSFKAANSGVVCISDLGRLVYALSNHFEIDNSMFIATWSISEAPIGLRNSILPLISSFKEYLIAYKSQFREVNNSDFFRSWTITHKDTEWHDYKIEHQPNDNRYLFGKKKTA